MAGSIKWVKYTADDGTPYAVRMDESNAEISGLGFSDFTASDEGLIAPLPSGMKMRYFNCYEPVDGLTRKIYVGDVASALFAIGATLFLPKYAAAGASSLVSFLIRGLVGERRTIAYGEDTGLTDGDLT